MQYDPLSIALAILATVIVGLAKGGFAGIGILATPIMALVMPPTTAAAILLPVLMVQDVVSVWAFRKTWDKWAVAWILPGALLGVVLGYFFAAKLPVAAVTGALGLITLTFGIYRLWMERGKREVPASFAPGWTGSLFGIAGGFTSQIAHAGGPPIQMWLAPRKYQHLTFVGTSCVTFAVINVAKVPAYGALGELTAANLTAAAMLTPIAIGSTLAGVWLIRRINTDGFYTMVYILMVLLGGKLVWDAIFG